MLLSGGQHVFTLPQTFPDSPFSKQRMETCLCHNVFLNYYRKLIKLIFTSVLTRSPYLDLLIVISCFALTSGCSVSKVTQMTTILPQLSSLRLLHTETSPHLTKYHTWLHIQLHETLNPLFLMININSTDSSIHETAGRGGGGVLLATESNPWQWLLCSSCWPLCSFPTDYTWIPFGEKLKGSIKERSVSQCNVAIQQHINPSMVQKKNRRLKDLRATDPDNLRNHLLLGH